MSVELEMLAWSIVLGLAQVMIAAALATRERGLKWNVGTREGAQPPLAGVAGRVERVSRNFLETFAFFAAAVLAVVAAQRTNSLSALGAQIYFWARIAYVPIYAAGIPYLRSVVWAVSVAGLVLVLSALF